MRDIEVDQQTDSARFEFQVRKGLCQMNGKDFFDGFDFDDNEIFHHEVEAISRVETNVAIDNR